MAKVKIQGHASGTGILTVTAPNTSTDRTITLPDATGTLLNSDGSGANLTNLPAAQVSGTHTSFTSTGIDDNADANAMTIGLDKRVAFKATTPKADLHLKAHNNTWTGGMLVEHNSGDKGWHIHPENNSENGLWFGYRADTTSAVGSESVAVHLQITSDGRGKSQFTAKAWIFLNGQTSTPTINDSHNVSSVTDNATAQYTINFSNNMANANYCAVAHVHAGGGTNDTNVVQMPVSGRAVGSVGCHLMSALNDATAFGNGTDGIVDILIFGD